MGTIQRQAIDLVLTERERQDEKWGKDRNQFPEIWMMILGEEYGELCQEVLNLRYGDPDKRRKTQRALLEELTQVTASGLAMLEDLLGRDEW